MPNSICNTIRTILEGLLKTYSHSLNDDSLRTLMAEVELIIYSRSLSVETISDSKSEIPLSPGNLLTTKTSVVMPPPGEFSKPDAYSTRRWRRVQNIAGEFCSRFEAGIFPESTSKADMEKEDLELCSW